MAKINRALLTGAALAAGLLAAQTASGTVIVQAVYNATSPGAAFTPSEPLGTILNTPLYETKKGACKTANACTYDFTFTLAGIAAGSTTQVQLQAAAQTQVGSTQEPLNYDLFSGKPGSTTTPTTSASFIAASTPINTVGEVISASLGDGTYYVQIMPSAVKVSGEIGSGSITEMAVPEPMAWTLMLMGFGGVGAALRRRSTLPASV